jgi:hypothetical protein
VSKEAPYSANKQRRTLNAKDGIARTQANNNFDPFARFVHLNPANINDGILAWAQIGIDPSADHTVDASWAAILAADGGHAVRGGKGKFGKKSKGGQSQSKAKAKAKAKSAKVAAGAAVV